MTDPYTPRPQIMHRWDGKVFHVRTVDPAHMTQAIREGWQANQSMAKASHEAARHRAAASPEMAAEPAIGRLAEMSKQSAALQDEDRRRYLFAKAKQHGLRFFAGIKTDELESKIIAHLQEQERAEIAKRQEHRAV